MARSPSARSPSTRSGKAKNTAAKDTTAPADSRVLILDAFLALLAEKGFETISLSEVAQRAGVPLGELRAAYGSTFDMLAAFIKRTDTKVLSAGGGDMDDQPARDRLFDVLMRRLDALAPYKAVIRSLAKSAKRNPLLALGLNRLSVRSQQWMLAEAGIDTSGLGGAVRAQGLVVVFTKVLRTFVDDDDPGLARTMAALDGELAKGERALGLLHDVCRLATCGRRGSRRTSSDAEPEAPVAA
ncbi:TetR/AcrR family transcriptional regulator [Bosea sp. 117]|uniref:TetR/AcrR family transcriptional regulator n=1 Tax=Bosea sp. 117 TaxID=1125973 RepID=UPI000A7BA730|nr:TetR/AcrR family transcriptional regulator [Bosea sp. 117]